MITNKIIGTIMGVAFGDAMGLPLELWSSEFIQKKLSDTSNDTLKNNVFSYMDKKYVNGFIKTHKNDFIGEYSDDTEMTLGIIESILLIGEVNSIHLLENFKKNYKESRGYGYNTSRILKGESINEKSDSNGGLMRISPIALWNLESTDSKLKKDIILVLNTTNHDTPTSIETCMLLCKIIIYMIKNTEPNSLLINEFISFLEMEISNYPNIEIDIRTVINNFKSGNDELKIISTLEPYSTNCIETFQKVINSLLFHWNEPELALSYIISYGGDTDTQTSILSSILGSRFGLDFMNEKFTIVENYEKILQLAKEFASLINYTYNTCWIEKFGL
jgi:ADP-ribosylglycohydrolase